MDDELANSVVAYLKNVPGMGYKIDYVVVSGSGGATAPAMSIAVSIASGGYDVVVGDTCASSCAQYLFLAGRRKYILKSGAVLPAWDPGVPDVYEEK